MGQLHSNVGMLEMKLITRDTLLSMSNVLYSEVLLDNSGNVCEIDSQVYIKYQNCGDNDWVYEPFPITEPDYRDTHDYNSTIYKFSQVGSGVVSNLNTCRDGCYLERDTKYVLYDKTDVGLFLRKLTRIYDNYGS